MEELRHPPFPRETFGIRDWGDRLMVCECASCLGSFRKERKSLSSVVFGATVEAATLRTNLL